MGKRTADKIYILYILHYFLISSHLFKWLLVEYVQSKSVLSLCGCASVCCSVCLTFSHPLSFSLPSFVYASSLVDHILPEQTAEPKTPSSASASLPVVLFSSLVPSISHRRPPLPNGLYLLTLLHCC